MLIAVQITVLVALILFNGLLSMAEMAIVSSSRGHLEEMAEEGVSGARAALALLDEPARFLSTVQIGITLVGVLSGAVGSATLADDFAILIARVPWLAPSSDTIAFITIVILTTYLSLVLGELAPKQLALNEPERVAVRLAPFMRFLSRVTAPLVRLLTASTVTAVRLLGVKLDEDKGLTEDDVRILLRQATREGVFEQSEQSLVERVFRLDDRPIDWLMTPRKRMTLLDIDDPFDQNWEAMITSGHTFFPVYRDSPDNIIGFVSVKELWPLVTGGMTVDLALMLHEPLFVPENAPALKLVELFRESGQSHALVIDEYGSLEGMVTLYDVVSSLLGDLEDEPDAAQREDGSWLLDGIMPFDEVQELIGSGDLVGEDVGDYNTLGGFVMSSIGRVPEPSDSFDVAGLRFEVMDMDGNRVDKVLVRRLASTGPGSVDDKEGKR